VQTVADLHFLEVAEIGVEFFERGLLRLVADNAGVLVEADIGDEVEDLSLEQFQPTWIAARGLVIFVDQRLQVLQRPVALGARQRWGQVVDDDRGCPALGLGALARIVDDEGIEMRQRAEDGFRIAGLGQRQRLARQPFEIAVLAHVDHRMGVELPAQIGVEGEIAVRRHEVRRMIGLLRLDIVAARRLDADHDIAEARQRQGEPAVEEERIPLRRAPPRRHLVLNLPWKTFEEANVIAY